MLYSWKAVVTVCNLLTTYCIPISGVYALYGIYEIQFSAERRKRYVRKDQEIGNTIPASCNKLQQTPSDSMLKEHIDSPNTDDSTKTNNGIYEIQFSAERRKRYVRKDEDIGNIIAASCNKPQQTPSDSIIKEHIDSPNTDDSTKTNNGKSEKNISDCFSNEKQSEKSKDSTWDSSNNNKKSQDSTPKSMKIYILNKNPKDKHMLDRSDNVFLLNSQQINLVGTVLTDKNREDTEKINCQTEIMIGTLGKEKQLTLIKAMYPNDNGGMKTLKHFIKGLIDYFDMDAFKCVTAEQLNHSIWDKLVNSVNPWQTLMSRTIAYLGNELAKCTVDPLLEQMQCIITVISTGTVKQRTSTRTSDNKPVIYVYGNAIPPSGVKIRKHLIMHLLDNCRCPHLEGESKLAFIKVYRCGNIVTVVHQIFDIIQNKDVLDIKRLLLTPSCEQHASYFTLRPEMLTGPKNANEFNASICGRINKYIKGSYLRLTSNKVSKYESIHSDKKDVMSLESYNSF